jgi:hypothetical protein
VPGRWGKVQSAGISAVSDTATTPVESTPGPPSHRHRSIWLVLAAAGAAIVLVGAGALLGASLNSHQGEINAQKAQIATLQQRGASLQHEVTVAQSQRDSAQTVAQNATATANAKAKADYASRVATVKQLERALRQKLAVVQSSTISADGVYVIGQDIPSGIYHTTGGNDCHYATLGSTDTSNILDNNIINGPATVNVSGAYALDISGGCTWTKIG